MLGWVWHGSFPTIPLWYPENVKQKARGISEIAGAFFRRLPPEVCTIFLPAWYRGSQWSSTCSRARFPGYALKSAQTPSISARPQLVISFFPRYLYSFSYLFLPISNDISVPQELPVHLLYIALSSLSFLQMPHAILWPNLLEHPVAQTQHATLICFSMVLFPHACHASIRFCL